MQDPCKESSLSIQKCCKFHSDVRNSFHLPKSVSSFADLYKCETESIASSATSKHRIDLLFTDSGRSAVSEYHINRKYCEPRKAKSLVEYKDDTNYPDTSVKNDVQVRIEKMFSEISSSEQEANTSLLNNKFCVTHLGCIPVQCKITSVEGLQEPLKELYIKYCTQSKKNSVGTIQINDKGLFIEYNDNNGVKVEKQNSFSTIAIWASLKFSCRNTNSGYECAFLPVITISDKNTLYERLDDNIAECLIDQDNSPLFVIVMREPNTPRKQLVCHGFICDSPEDAVIIAATLYRILMSRLGKNRVLKSKNQRRHAKSMSNRLSSIGETSLNEITEPECNYSEVIKSPLSLAPSSPPSPSPPPPPPPTRPPRKSKEQEKSERNYAGSIREPSKMFSESGDVLTKIAIPRSSSFLNTNRLGLRYESKPVEQVQRNNLSPLGLMEMLNELQSQEGLKTLDEILNVIINSEGMSFNELKPIYKEFLMKLALVLSKDELYHRSKSIMKLQKQRKSSRMKKVITTRIGLKNILFRKPLVKLKSNKTTSCSCRKGDSKLYSDCTSTDSFFLTNRPKPEAKLRPMKNISRHKSFRFRSQQLITSTSEDSDYPKINHKKIRNKFKDDPLRPSSSGYFSFSECSYDTESCTCTSADKCYCSLSKEKKLKKSRANISVCSCERMACSRRNKCYGTKKNNLSLVEQLKQKGFAVSESSLSPDDSHHKISVKDKSNTKLSKSLEYLENSKKYKNRMELYDSGQKSYSCRHNYKYSSSLSSESSRNSQKQSSTSDNLRVDYSMFTKSEDQRKIKDLHRNCKRNVTKQNVVYAELACPQRVSNPAFNRNYPISSVLSGVEKQPVVTMFSHSPIRTCSCSCTCPMYTGEAYPSFHHAPRFSSTPLHRINMENVFGYYP